MEQVLHGSARTTQVVRRAIPHGQSLATRNSTNPGKLAKWRKHHRAQKTLEALQLDRKLATQAAEDLEFAQYAQGTAFRKALK